MANDRRDRSAFLYFEPDPDIPDHAQCSSCRNWLIDQERCFWLPTDFEVDGDDTCGLYGQGPPCEGNEPVPTGQYSPEEVGFYDGEVQCRRCISETKGSTVCALFEKLNQSLPEIWMIDVAIKPRGCCNAWWPKKNGPKAGILRKKDET